ncbi:MAG: hypothetical protein IJ129_04470, partial [Ruminococcus sp.]|nr:hypothetical protein [Ruminococcus sp.]
MKISKIFAGMSAMAIAMSMMATVNAFATEGEGEGEPAEAASIGSVGLFVQNKGGNWAWYNDTTEGAASQATITEGTEFPAQYHLEWDGIQEQLRQAEWTPYTPVEEWETVPAFGVQLANAGITKAGDMGHVGGTAKVAVYSTAYEEPIVLNDIDLDMDLTGKEETWGVSGNANNFEFTELIKQALDLDNAEFMEFFGTVNKITADVKVTDISTLGGKEAATAKVGFATADWGLQDWDTTCEVKNGLNLMEFTLAESENEDGSVNTQGKGVQVFVIDMEGEYERLADLQLKVTGITVNDQWVPFEYDVEKDMDYDKIVYGDIEEKGNWRIDIYNAWGKTTTSEKFDEAVSPFNPENFQWNAGDVVKVYFEANSLFLPDREDAELVTKPKPVEKTGYAFQAEDTEEPTESTDEPTDSEPTDSEPTDVTPSDVTPADTTTPDTKPADTKAADKTTTDATTTKGNDKANSSAADKAAAAAAATTTGNPETGAAALAVVGVAL